MTMNKSTRREAFDAVMDGQDVCIEFDRVTTWSTDHHYGADADGHRGISRTDIDEDYAEEIVVLTWTNGADGHREIVTPITALTSLQALEVQQLIDLYLEENEPTWPDDDEPDDEPDGWGD